MVHHSFWITKKYKVPGGTMHLFIGMDALSMTQAIEAVTGKKYAELNVEEISHDRRSFTMKTQVGETFYLVEQRESRPVAPEGEGNLSSYIDGRSNVKERKGYQLKFF